MRPRKILEDAGFIRAKFESKGQRARRIFNNYVLTPMSIALFLLAGKCTYDKIITPQVPRITFDKPSASKYSSKKPDGEHVYIVSDRGGTDFGILEQLNTAKHTEEARKLHYETLKDTGRAPAKTGERKKNVEPTLEETISKEDGYLNFERQTSYIQPRPVTSIDESVKDAIIFLDVSNSMQRNVHNDIYIPAVAAIAISNYYIDEKGASVSGAIFNIDTAHTGFTRDKNLLAKLFSKKPGGGTILDVHLLQKLVSNPNRTYAGSLVDLYIISDLEFFNIQQLIGTIDVSKFGRIYVLEVGSKNPGITTKIFGRDAYRAPLNDYDDIKDFYKKFRQDNTLRSSSRGNSFLIRDPETLHGLLHNGRNPSIPTHNLREVAKLPEYAKSQQYLRSMMRS